MQRQMSRKINIFFYSTLKSTMQFFISICLTINELTKDLKFMSTLKEQRIISISAKLSFFAFIFFRINTLNVIVNHLVTHFFSATL